MIGNWKMNPLTLKEAEKLFAGTAGLIAGDKKVEVVVCPPFLYLEKLRKISKRISVGAQNGFFEDTGAFTGEVSLEMLYDIGARYVILGHSERRAMGETDMDVNKKVKSAIKASFTPVLCIGESARDENHEYLNFIRKELEACLAGISRNSVSKLIIAYEPIWAIGEGAHSATPEEFLEMSIFIKKILSDKFGVEAGGKIRIIYGGSADEKNAGEFLKIGKADGFLLGRASLNPKKFNKIIQIAGESKG